MSDSTYQLIVEQARQLFARKGLTNTTMNDIAQASGKGRRTIYTYFNNKQDIYWAVITSELNRLYDRLEVVVKKPLPPNDKLEEYIDARLEGIREIVLRNGSLRAEFFRDITEVERARKKSSLVEIEMLRSILDEGVACGKFIVHNTLATATILHCAFKGLEVPYINNQFSEVGIERNRIRCLIADFMLYGIMR
ncbi:MAG: TetR/AcrR family transcriptional regulator [Bacteroidaceae bacterium]|nr:TetR/AcrR family transcriptional regulator [Bacteroidaceae bacterium]